MDLPTILMKYSFGLVRTRDQALVVLLGLAIVLGILAIIIFSGDATVPNTSPHVKRG